MSLLLFILAFEVVNGDIKQDEIIAGMMIKRETYKLWVLSDDIVKMFENSFKGVEILMEN